MEWILHHESKVRNLEGPDMCHVELPPEFYSLINGPNSVTILCCYHLNKLQTFMSIKSLNQIRQDNLNLNFWLVVSQFSFLRFFVSFHKNIPGLGGPVVVANRSKANGGSDDPWRYNWNSHGCSSWRPTDQQFSRKKQPTTAINGCLPNLGETKRNVEKIVTFKEAIHICNWWKFSRLC